MGQTVICLPFKHKDTRSFCPRDLSKIRGTSNGGTIEFIFLTSVGQHRVLRVSPLLRIVGVLCSSILQEMGSLKFSATSHQETGLEGTGMVILRQIKLTMPLPHITSHCSFPKAAETKGSGGRLCRRRGLRCRKFYYVR